MTSCVHPPLLLLQDHPLAGRIWDTRGARFVDAGVMENELPRMSIVLLGETHDNPEHHRIQAVLLEALSVEGAPRVLAMEQFDIEHQSAIDAARRQPGVSAEDLATAGRMDRAGWDWPLYEPLITRALARSMSIVAANLSRLEARRVAASGFGALGPERTEALALDSTWSAEREGILRAVIRDGHCGKLPELVLPGIVRAQRARDATMAQVVARSAPGGVLAIVGRGHARRDVGIPLYLTALAPQAETRVLAMVEVEDGIADPEAYLPAQREPVAGPVYDFLWFTPRALRPDPCAGLSSGRLGSVAAGG